MWQRRNAPATRLAAGLSDLVGRPLLDGLDGAVRALDGLPAVHVDTLVRAPLVVVRGGVVVVVEEDLGVRRCVPEDLLRDLLRS